MIETKVGIDKIGFYIPRGYLDISKLAKKRGIDPDKWTKGIGQEKMSIISHNEDIVSMAINASLQILDEDDKMSIDQVVFATESSFDYSKAASTFLIQYLKLNNNVRSYEIKQACYSATAAIQLACDYVRLRPQKKVLVIASDIAKYGLNSSGEVTQGAGSVSILISSNPRIFEIDINSMFLTQNEFDFWRPEGSIYPIVQSKYSVDLYISTFKTLIKKYNSEVGDLSSLDSILFHLPFSKMGKKALISLKEDLKEDLQNSFEKWVKSLESSSILSKNVGNIYTGSLYMSLLSLILYSELESGNKIGLFSYGSGCVAEFFTATLSKDFRDYIKTNDILKDLENRVEVDVDEYEKLYFNKGINLDVREGSFFFVQDENKREYIKFSRGSQ